MLAAPNIKGISKETIIDRLIGWCLHSSPNSKLVIGRNLCFLLLDPLTFGSSIKLLDLDNPQNEEDKHEVDKEEIEEFTDFG